MITKNRAMGYIRVSTARQAVQGLSLQAQLETIRSYCKTYDLEFVGYKVDSVSGKDLAHRPGAQALLKKARLQKIDHIVVFKLERMFRNTRECLRTVEELDKLGVGFHSITERWDTKTPIGKFSLTLFAAIAQLEREKIAERTKHVLGFKKLNGEKLGRFNSIGKTEADKPDKKDGKTRGQKIDWHEIKAIRLAQELNLQKMTYRAISQELANRGFISPRSGKPYAPSTIRRMATMEIPTGEVEDPFFVPGVDLSHLSANETASPA